MSRPVHALFVIGVAGLFLVAGLAYPPSMPLPAGTVLHIVRPVVLTFTVGPGNGTLVGAWKADGPTVAFVWVPQPGCATCNENLPSHNQTLWKGAMSGSFDEVLAPGTYELAFGTPKSWSVPLLTFWPIFVNVTVTQTIQVVYGT